MSGEYPLQLATIEGFKVIMVLDVFGPRQPSDISAQREGEGGNLPWGDWLSPGQLHW